MYIPPRNYTEKELTARFHFLLHKALSSPPVVLPRYRKTEKTEREQRKAAEAFSKRILQGKDLKLNEKTTLNANLLFNMLKLDRVIFDQIKRQVKREYKNLTGVAVDKQKMRGLFKNLEFIGILLTALSAPGNTLLPDWDLIKKQTPEKKAFRRLELEDFVTDSFPLLHKHEIEKSVEKIKATIKDNSSKSPIFLIPVHFGNNSRVERSSDTALDPFEKLAGIRLKKPKIKQQEVNEEAEEEEEIIDDKKTKKKSKSKNSKKIETEAGYDELVIGLNTVNLVRYGAIFYFPKEKKAMVLDPSGQQKTFKESTKAIELITKTKKTKITLIAPPPINSQNNNIYPILLNTWVCNLLETIKNEPARVSTSRELEITCHEINTTFINTKIPNHLRPFKTEDIEFRTISSADPSTASLDKPITCYALNERANNDTKWVGGVVLYNKDPERKKSKKHRQRVHRPKRSSIIAIWFGPQQREAYLHNANYKDTIDLTPQLNRLSGDNCRQITGSMVGVDLIKIIKIISVNRGAGLQQLSEILKRQFDRHRKTDPAHTHFHLENIFHDQKNTTSDSEEEEEDGEEETAIIHNTATPFATEFNMNDPEFINQQAYFRQQVRTKLNSLIRTKENQLEPHLQKPIQIVNFDYLKHYFDYLTLNRPHPNLTLGHEFFPILIAPFLPGKCDLQLICTNMGDAKRLDWIARVTADEVALKSKIYLVMGSTLFKQKIKIPNSHSNGGIKEEENDSDDPDPQEIYSIYHHKNRQGEPKWTILDSDPRILEAIKAILKKRQNILDGHDEKTLAPFIPNIIKKVAPQELTQHLVWTVFTIHDQKPVLRTTDELPKEIWQQDTEQEEPEQQQEEESKGEENEEEGEEEEEEAVKRIKSKPISNEEKDQLAQKYYHRPFARLRQDTRLELLRSLKAFAESYTKLELSPLSQAGKVSLKIIPNVNRIIDFIIYARIHLLELYANRPRQYVNTIKEKRRTHIGDPPIKTSFHRRMATFARYNRTRLHTRLWYNTPIKAKKSSVTELDFNTVNEFLASFIKQQDIWHIMTAMIPYIADGKKGNTTLSQQYNNLSGTDEGKEEEEEEEEEDSKTELMRKWLLAKMRSDSIKKWPEDMQQSILASIHIFLQDNIKEAIIEFIKKPLKGSITKSINSTIVYMRGNTKIITRAITLGMALTSTIPKPESIKHCIGAAITAAITEAIMGSIEECIVEKSKLMSTNNAIKAIIRKIRVTIIPRNPSPVTITKIETAVAKLVTQTKQQSIPKSKTKTTTIPTFVLEAITLAEEMHNNMARSLHNPERLIIRETPSALFSSAYSGSYLAEQYAKNILLVFNPQLVCKSLGVKRDFATYLRVLAEFIIKFALTPFEIDENKVKNESGGEEEEEEEKEHDDITQHATAAVNAALCFCNAIAKSVQQFIAENFTIASLIEHILQYLDKEMANPSVIKNEEKGIIKLKRDLIDIFTLIKVRKNKVHSLHKPARQILRRLKTLQIQLNNALKAKPKLGTYDFTPLEKSILKTGNPRHSFRSTLAAIINHLEIIALGDRIELIAEKVLPNLLDIQIADHNEINLIDCPGNNPFFAIQLINIDPELAFIVFKYLQQAKNDENFADDIGILFAETHTLITTMQTPETTLADIYFDSNVQEAQKYLRHNQRYFSTFFVNDSTIKRRRTIISKKEVEVEIEDDDGKIDDHMLKLKNDFISRLGHENNFDLSALTKFKSYFTDEEDEEREFRPGDKNYSNTKTLQF